MRTFTYILASLCVLSPHLCRANTFLVTTNADTNTPGTLRNAILSATNPGDVINFTLPFETTIYLSSNLPPLNVPNVTINGSGQTPIIYGADSYQIFFINANGITIEDMILSHGAAIGGKGGDGGLVFHSHPPYVFHWGGGQS